MSKDQKWSKIDWTAGLPIPRKFEDHELPLNKDMRYAMSVSPESLRDASGRVMPLRAQISNEPVKVSGNGDGRLAAKK